MGVRAERRLAPHIRRQALALEDVAAGEADLLLDVRRPQDLRVDDGAVDVGAEAAEGIEGEVADFVAAFVPGAMGKGVRHILRKDAHGVLPCGHDGGSCTLWK